MGPVLCWVAKIFLFWCHPRAPVHTDCFVSVCFVDEWVVCHDGVEGNQKHFTETFDFLNTTVFYNYSWPVRVNIFPVSTTCPRCLRLEAECVQQHPTPTEEHRGKKQKKLGVPDQGKQCFFLHFQLVFLFDSTRARKNRPKKTFFSSVWTLSLWDSSQGARNTQKCRHHQQNSNGHTNKKMGDDRSTNTIFLMTKKWWQEHFFLCDSPHFFWVPPTGVWGTKCTKCLGTHWSARSNSASAVCRPTRKGHASSWECTLPACVTWKKTIS